MSKKLAVLFILLAFVLPSFSWASDFPQPTGFVNDFAGVFSDGFRQELEQNLEDFEKKTSAEIAVVTIKSLGDYTIEEYAVRLFEDWKIGKKKKNNGLLLLIAEEDRQVRIEVGYGLEPIITDGRAGRIIREEMAPYFKKEDYDQGVRLAIAQIKDYIQSGEPPKGVEAVEEKAGQFLPVFLIGLFVLVWMAAFLGRTKEFYTGGILGGLLGGFFGLLLGGLLIVFFLAVLFGLLGLILDFIFSRNYQKLKAKGKPTGFFPSWGGFSSGGKSFGGFGGGSSGGGGASGSW